MNKLNLFAIIGIVSAFATALILGSIVTPVSAQGNTTMTMDNMTMDNMTMDNMTMDNMTMDNMTMDNQSMPMSNMSNMNMTMKTDSVVIGESQVAPPIMTTPQVGEGSNSTTGADSSDDDSSDDDSSDDDSSSGESSDSGSND